jgi:hypothetical protein
MLRVVWLGVECQARDATRGVRVQGFEEWARVRGAGGWRRGDWRARRRVGGLFVWCLDEAATLVGRATVVASQGPGDERR